MSRIAYLSSARLPTENANGFQVMKMCEAMAGLGHEVELLHPWRHQADAALAESDPFPYYGVSPTFRVRTLPNWDVVRLEPLLPSVAFRALFSGHELAWGLLAARRAARAEPDLLYTRNFSYAYWAARLGQPCAFEAHRPPGSRRTASLLQSFAKRSATRAVFALTGHTAAELEAAGVPAGKLHVLPDAADLGVFADAPPKEEARSRLGLPAGRPIVGYVGRFKTMGKEKGVRDLIRAVAASELRGLDPLLVCVGGPIELVEEYVQLAHAAGLPDSALRFVDRVPNPEVPTWLAALDVAVMPAPEGASNGRYPATERYATATSPLKLFEYMAAGLPIVAADLPGVREVLDDGETGVLVSPGDPEAIGRALSRVLGDPARARGLGERARAEAARYTWSRRAERALHVALEGRTAESG